MIVCGYPLSASFRRRLVLPKMSMKELNEKLSVISRVVVHPKYRTIGLGTKLIKDALPLAGTEYVEMSAVMAKYNPFAEKAGMTRIVEQHPPKEALNILTILEKLGFDSQLLNSESHVKHRLEAPTNSEILKVKEVFTR